MYWHFVRSPAVHEGEGVILRLFECHLLNLKNQAALGLLQMIDLIIDLINLKDLKGKAS